MQHRTTLETFFVPIPLEKLPWSRLLSEHYSEAKVESSAWIESFEPFDAKHLESFRKCDFSLLASYFYAPREKVLIRLGCDLMNLFFVFDEYTDVEDKSGAQKICDMIMEIMKDPSKVRPKGEVCVGAIAKDFFHRVYAQVQPDAPCLQHFLSGWEEYIHAVAQEAEDRTKGTYRTFSDYLQMRRRTSGGAPSFALIEFGLDIPEEVYNHHLLASLRSKALDLNAVQNDIYSYAMEKSRGLAIHNAVEVIMNEQGISLQAAMDWLDSYCADAVDGFRRDAGALPSWGWEIDQKVSAYINGLGQALRGLYDWHFESERYFGSKGPEVRQTRVMTLLPPSHGYVIHGERGIRAVPDM